MKKIYTLIFLATASYAQAQITINSSHLPTGGDLLYARAATFLTTVDLEQTGANHTWNFGFDVLQPGALNAGTSYENLSSLSLVDQLIFNNPFYPEYDSNFGLGTSLVNNPLITIEDAYQIYKNSGGVYAATGLVATVSGVPLAAQYQDRDIIYDLPLTYPASGNSHSMLSLDVPTVAYYGTDQYRNYVVDGWGTINIYDQSFDVLRVRSTVTGFDSVAVNFNGFPFGLQIPKDNTIYQWISTANKVPILEVISSGGGFGGAQLQIQTADIYQDMAVAELAGPVIQLYPNPSSNTLHIIGLNGITNASVFDAQGNSVWKGSISNGQLDVSHLASGVYMFQAVENGTLRSARFIKQ